MNKERVEQTISNCVKHGFSGIYLEPIFEVYNKVNHSYDGFSYDLHLKMVMSNVLKYANLIITPIEIIDEDEIDLEKRRFSNESIDDYYIPKYLKILLYSAALHDAIEDCRMTYNDVKQLMLNITHRDYFVSENVAEIVYAVTNEKGKNRAERANDAYYEGIRKTSFATFIKYCDRLANIQYGNIFKHYLGGNRMIEVYKKEQSHFISMLESEESKQLKPMEDEMNELLI